MFLSSALSLRVKEFCITSVTFCFPDGSVVKNAPAKQEIRVQSLVWEDPLKKEIATPSSILVGEIPWTEEPGGLQSMGSQKESETTWLSD